MRTVPRPFLLLLLATPAWSQVSKPESPFAVASRLDQEGHATEAFLKYLEIPGAEHLALRIARPKAAEFLERLDQRAPQPLSSRHQMIRGDLLLALGRKDEALATYRKAAESLNIPATSDDVSPYWVEPPETLADHVVPPFTFGPGSHRDNWLLRRLIAIEAWDEAARELGRVWEHHRRRAQPYLVEMGGGPPIPGSPPGRAEAPVRHVLVRPAGFDGLGLQYALDYAFFLKRRQRIDDALSILREPLLALDLDRNPNTSRPGEALPNGAPLPALPVLRNEMMTLHFAYREATAGVSRKEFIRLAYGAFKEAGREGDLTALLEGQIAKGENRARRLLARIRMMQGNPAEALVLELDYLRQGTFDDLSATYRRGLAFEEVQRLAEAATELEKVLAMPFQPPRLPDPDEEEIQRRMMCQRLLPFDGDGATPLAQARFNADVLDCLQRLYGALGRGEKALEIALRQLETDPAMMDRFDALERAARQFRAAGREAAFLDWARAQAATAGSPLARAGLHWLARDPAAAARALGDVARAGRVPEEWKERFRASGVDALRLLLAAWVEAAPKDAVSRLEFLDLEDRFEGPAVIAAFEGLLEEGAAPAFERGKGATNRTRFRNYPDLAGRLMRLYERQGDAAAEARLVALGFRVLEGRKPFERDEQLLRAYRTNWNDSLHDPRIVARDTLFALYILLHHLKDPADVRRAAALAERSGCIPLINQVHGLLPDKRGERLDPSETARARYRDVVVRTPGLPDGVKILTQRDDVRSVSRDGSWIGTSWGLVRYRETGPGETLEILQIPLGARVTAFCETPAGLFAGTWTGLYRIDDPDGKDPVPVRIDIEEALPMVRAVREPARVEQLLWWKDRLWVTSRREVFSFDPVKKTVQAQADIEGPLFAGLGRLWSKQAVFDEPSGEFEPIRCVPRQWRLLGATAREIWADVWVDDAIRHRPALFDPGTKTLGVLPVANPPSRDALLINSDIDLLAEAGDRVWLLGDGNVMLYDRAVPKPEVRILSRGQEPVAGAAPPVAGAPIVPYANARENSAFHFLHCATGRREAVPGLTLAGDRGPHYGWRERPDGALLLGAAIVREWPEDNLGHDDDGGMSQHVQDLEGGLFAIRRAPEGALRWTKLGARDGELTDFYVKKIVADDEARRAYVCTNGGVTVLSLPDGAVVGRITVSDGLPSNKVEDVARIGDRLFLACELGDEGGGLAIQDLRTGLIQVLTLADGLKSDKIKALRAEGTKLHILYGSVYATRAYGTPMEGSVPVPGPEGQNRGVRTFRSSVLDTATGRLAEGGEIRPFHPPPKKDAVQTLPILGGEELCRLARPGVQLIGGTHGLVLAPAPMPGDVRGARPATESIVPVRSRRQSLLADVKTRAPNVKSEAQLALALRDENPFYRAEALASSYVFSNGASLMPLIIPALEDPSLRVRCTALFQALQSGAAQETLVPALQRRLDDPEDSVRVVATIGLCQRGRVPDLHHLREALAAEGVNFPFGADTSIGIQGDAKRLCEAVAPHASPEIFALLMERPPRVVDHDHKTKVFPQLGAALRRHPESADVLLAARDEVSWGTTRQDFARDVFRFAGQDLLPVLHRALESADRVVRSNAARACDAIGDPSSIPPLLKALDLESGLSRASIVGALGTLKAREALPALEKLYIDAVNDERRGRGSGYRFAQQKAAVERQFETIANLDALGSGWNELQAAARPRGIDPRQDERLLEADDILKAVREIGPAAAQVFYRSLAGSKDREARWEAASALAEGSPADRETSRPLLKSLLADNDERIRIRAAASLLILGEEAAARPVLVEALKGVTWQQSVAVSEMLRVGDRAPLAFAREAVRSIAARNGDEYALRQQAAELLKKMR